MNNELYCIYHISINTSDFSKFKELATELVDKTSKEIGTITYEYVVNEDFSSVHILERYNINGVLPHINETFAPFSERFLKYAKIDRLFVYGDPSPEIKSVLDGFGAIYFESFSGFSR